MKRLFLLPLIIVGCVAGSGDVHDVDDVDDVDDLGSTDQAATVLDVCAVGHAANATSSVTPTLGDVYGRSSVTMNLIGANRCDCLDWQGLADSIGEAAANTAYPKCRPATLVDFTVTGTTASSLVHFESFTELTEKVHTALDCSRSNLHMELWKSIGRGVWQRMWASTLVAHWDAGRCYQTAGASSPSVANGLYRVNAVATPTAEQGYETVVIRTSP